MDEISYSTQKDNFGIIIFPFSQNVKQSHVKENRVLFFIIPYLIALKRYEEFRDLGMVFGTKIT